MWICLSRKKAETGPKFVGYVGLAQGVLKRVGLSRLYHGSIMYLSRCRDYGCLSRTYHVVGTRR